MGSVGDSRDNRPSTFILEKPYIYAIKIDQIDDWVGFRRNRPQIPFPQVKLYVSFVKLTSGLCHDPDEVFYLLILYTYLFILYTNYYYNWIRCIRRYFSAYGNLHA